jgi:oligopeptide transport system substrate-binding protein
MFSDNAPCFPLLHMRGAVAVQPRVKGIVFSSFQAPINYYYADIVH